jgi:hypothetical protein
MPNENGTARLERIERALEMLINDHVQFREEHKTLLSAQVVLTDNMAKLAIAQKELAEAQKHTDERLNALIEIVDGVVRKPRPS